VIRTPNPLTRPEFRLIGKLLFFHKTRFVRSISFIFNKKHYFSRMLFLHFALFSAVIRSRPCLASFSGLKDTARFQQIFQYRVPA
jgi:hypothetical protein